MKKRVVKKAEVLTEDERKALRAERMRRNHADIAAAAAALMAALGRQYDLGEIDYVWINWHFVGAVYVDASEGALVAWRSDEEARRGIIPMPGIPRISQRKRP